MFTEKCFIRVNNEEITDNLKDFGYELLPTAQIHEGENVVCCYGTCFSQDIIPDYVYIDCGYNIELFLYTAALRYDSDNFQLFFNNKDTDCKYPIECIHDEFHMFSIDPDNCECIDHTDEYHKGTPNELQKHFKINR